MVFKTLKKSAKVFKDYGPPTASLWARFWGHMSMINSVRFTETFAVVMLSIYLVIRLGIIMYCWVTTGMKPVDPFTGFDFRATPWPKALNMLYLFAEFVGFFLAVSSISLLKSGMDNNSLKCLDEWLKIRLFLLEVAIAAVLAKLFVYAEVSAIGVYFTLYFSYGLTIVHYYTKALRIRKQSNNRVKSVQLPLHPLIIRVEGTRGHSKIFPCAHPPWSVLPYYNVDDINATTKQGSNTMDVTTTTASELKHQQNPANNTAAEQRERMLIEEV